MTLATQTLEYIITDSANPTAITPGPSCKNPSYDGGHLLNSLFTSINFSTIAINITRAMVLQHINEQASQDNWHFHKHGEKRFLKLLPSKFLSGQYFPLLSNRLFAFY